jgi:hypothetical protein
MGTSPAKNLLPPIGYQTFWTNGPSSTNNLISPPKMFAAFSPVFLNPRILVPRFVLVTAFTSAQAPIFHSYLNGAVPVGEVESRCGTIGVTTFPAVYQAQNGDIPAFGQIYPRGLD